MKSKSKKNYIKRVGCYYLVKSLGKSEVSETFITVKEKTGELFITKGISFVILENKNISKNFNTEINHLSELKLNNNIILSDSLKTGKNLYIMTEYCNGGNLKEFQTNYISKHKSELSEKFIQKVISQIASGLEYMYKKNIIHCQLYPKNIFINFNKYKNKDYTVDDDLPPKINYNDIDINSEGEEFSVKIGNFFRSKKLEESKINSIILGESNFMSPDMAEKLMGKEDKNIDYDEKYDIWCLGIMTYELLTGKTPFEGNDSQETYKKIINGIYTFPNGLKISVEIISFIANLLQYPPQYNNRMDLSEIKEHPFLKKNVNDFKYIEFDDNNKIEISIKENDIDNLMNNLLSKVDKRYIDYENELKIKDNEINELNQKIIDLNKENEKEMNNFENELSEIKKMIETF